MGPRVHGAAGAARPRRPEGANQGEPRGEGTTTEGFAHAVGPLARVARRRGRRRAFAPAEHDREGARDEGLRSCGCGSEALSRECEAMSLERPQIEKPDGDI